MINIKKHSLIISQVGIDKVLVFIIESKYFLYHVKGIKFVSWC